MKNKFQIEETKKQIKELNKSLKIIFWNWIPELFNDEEFEFLDDTETDSTVSIIKGIDC